MGLDLFIPRFTSGEWAPGKDHEDLVAIHRLSPVSKRSEWPGGENTARQRVSRARLPKCVIYSEARRMPVQSEESEERLGEGGGERRTLMPCVTTERWWRSTCVWNYALPFSPPPTLPL